MSGVTNRATFFCTIRIINANKEVSGLIILPLTREPAFCSQLSPADPVLSFPVLIDGVCTGWATFLQGKLMFVLYDDASPPFSDVGPSLVLTIDVCPSMCLSGVGSTKSWYKKKKVSKSLKMCVLLYRKRF